MSQRSAARTAARTEDFLMYLLIQATIPADHTSYHKPILALPATQTKPKLSPNHSFESRLQNDASISTPRTLRLKTLCSNFIDASQEGGLTHLPEENKLELWAVRDLRKMLFCMLRPN